MMRKFVWTVVCAMVMPTLFACSGGDEKKQMPTAPQNVTASARDGQISITWSDVSGASSYNVYWSNTPGVTKATGSNISNVTSPYTHNGCTNNTTYYYIVAALNNNGESDASNQVSATPISATSPLTKDAGNVTDVSALISGGFYNPSGYATSAWFEYGTTTSYGNSTAHQGSYAIDGTMDISADLAQLQERTAYHYRIVTQNSSGTFYGEDRSFTTYITPGTLAPGYGAGALAVDATDVYWVDGSSVNKVGINGGAVTQLASEGGTAIAMDPTSVYWVGSGAIKKVGKSGGSVVILATGLGPTSRLAVDATHVYWADDAIRKVSIHGGSVITLASGVIGPSDIAVDSTSVYWSGCANGNFVPWQGPDEWNWQWACSSGVIKKVGINGGSVTTLVDANINSSPAGIAIDSTSVYWAERYGSTAVKKVAINGGTVTTLAISPYNLNTTDGIAVDASSVYWTERLRTIKKVGINGGSITTLVSGYAANAIAMDPTSLYFGVGIMKAPKSY